MSQVINDDTRTRLQGLLGQLRKFRAMSDATEPTLQDKRITRARQMSSWGAPAVSSRAFDDVIRIADDLLLLLSHELLPWLEQVVAEMDRLDRVTSGGERAAAVAALRAICAAHGDNDWPDDLHLGDVLDKHLARHLGVEL